MNSFKCMGYNHCSLECSNTSLMAQTYKNLFNLYKLNQSSNGRMQNENFIRYTLFRLSNNLSLVLFLLI